MLFKVTIFKTVSGMEDTTYIHADDKESADYWAESQADSYGCDHYNCKPAFSNEIPKDAVVVYT